MTERGGGGRTARSGRACRLAGGVPPAGRGGGGSREPRKTAEGAAAEGGGLGRNFDAVLRAEPLPYQFHPGGAERFPPPRSAPRFPLLFSARRARQKLQEKTSRRGVRPAATLKEPADMQETTSGKGFRLFTVLALPLLQPPFLLPP